MTMAEIAKLAGVSVSTVSKILNHKDQAIREDTRQRVLDLIEAHHYVPFGNRLVKQAANLLGVLSGPVPNQAMLGAILQRAQESGYAVLIQSFRNAEEEYQCANRLFSHYVDGVLWCKSTQSDQAVSKIFAEHDIPVLEINPAAPPSEHNAFFSYLELGMAAAEAVLSAGHERIGCIVPNGEYGCREFVDGVRQALLKQGLSYQASDTIVWADNFYEQIDWLEAHTAALCFNETTATALYQRALQARYSVPDMLSVVTLYSGGSPLSVPLSYFQTPYQAIGRFAAESLISQIAGNGSQPIYHENFKVSGPDSIAPPHVRGRKKILVMGTINMDTLLYVDHYPGLGETTNVLHRSFFPGGKGLNQALATARLNGNAHLIGCLGKDVDGRGIQALLRSNAIGLDGVWESETEPTGRAYIQIQSDGESGILIVDGANQCVTEDQLESRRPLFRDTAYCLLQTELPQNVVIQAAALAKEAGARVILKPCAVDTIQENLLRYVDILVPNKQEAERLLPGRVGPDEQADAFLRCGVGTVIITLGEDGCLVYQGKRRWHIPAAPVQSVDTTGAADAFIATLAVYLARGAELLVAAQYATCAAGLSTTRYGVPPSLVERGELELFYQRTAQAIQPEEGTMNL